MEQWRAAAHHSHDDDRTEREFTVDFMTEHAPPKTATIGTNKVVPLLLLY
jgi:hypothetical protein